MKQIFNYILLNNFYCILPDAETLLISGKWYEKVCQQYEDFDFFPDPLEDIHNITNCKYAKFDDEGERIYKWSDYMGTYCINLNKPYTKN